MIITDPDKIFVLKMTKKSIIFYFHCIHESKTFSKNSCLDFHDTVVLVLLWQQGGATSLTWSENPADASTSLLRCPGSAPQSSHWKKKKMVKKKNGKKKKKSRNKHLFEIPALSHKPFLNLVGKDWNSGCPPLTPGLDCDLLKPFQTPLFYGIFPSDRKTTKKILIRQSIQTLDAQECNKQEYKQKCVNIVEMHNILHEFVI